MTIAARRPTLLVSLLVGLFSLALWSPLSAAQVDTSEFEILDPLFGLSGAYDLRSMILAADPAADPEELGGMRFLTLDNGDEVLCVVDNAENTAQIYCFGVVRGDLSNGNNKITDLTYDESGPIEIENTDGTIAYEIKDLDLGFAPGPGGYDFISFYYEQIALGEWVTDSLGRPKLRLVHYMDVSPIFDDGAYGLAFSNTIQDPQTGHGMLFATVYDAVVEVPLVPSGAVYEIDYGNVRFLCSLDYKSLYLGDMVLIQGGAYANDYVLTDYDTNGLYILNVDETTGYPAGVDETTHIPYMLPYEDKEVTHANGIACPLRQIIDPGPSYSPWGAVFDENTGDLLFSHFDSNKAVVFHIEGFDSTLSPTLSPMPSEIPSSTPSSGPTLSSQPSLAPSSGPTLSIEPSSSPSFGPSPSPAQYSNFVTVNENNGGCSYEMSYEGVDYSFSNKPGASEEGAYTNECREYYTGRCTKRRWTCTFNNLPQDAPSEYYTAIESCRTQNMNRYSKFKWGRLEVDSATNTATLICVACDPNYPNC